jgi:hypothetical protein
MGRAWQSTNGDAFAPVLCWEIKRTKVRERPHAIVFCASHTTTTLYSAIHSKHRVATETSTDLCFRTVKKDIAGMVLIALAASQYDIIALGLFDNRQ